MPPRRWDLFGLVAVVVVAVYVLAVPRIYAAADYPREGPLSYTAPPLQPTESLHPSGPTAAEVAERERDEWGTCSGDSRLVVVGGMVNGKPYFAVYDVTGDEICLVTFRDGRTGDDLDEDGFGGRSVTRVAKDGGAWPWMAPVRTAGDVRLGLAAVVTGLALGGFLSRRDILPTAADGDGAVTRWVYRLFLGGSALVLLVLNIDVLGWPDRLGYLVIGLVDAAWL